MNRSCPRVWGITLKSGTHTTLVDVMENGTNPIEALTSAAKKNPKLIPFLGLELNLRRHKVASWLNWRVVRYNVRIGKFRLTVT